MINEDPLSVLLRYCLYSLNNDKTYKSS